MHIYSLTGTLRQAYTKTVHLFDRVLKRWSQTCQKQQNTYNIINIYITSFWFISIILN